ncbi:hypothetical protein PVL29_013081 [Vitis rotundifolia]|uniref:Precursor of CEP14 n=1 Tax=Vitis rotundifolia TaxID=103349 RepID=A0AA39DNV0_VITRO|nr:hypothetical protein PVL29_013081 [Vitis rotundifolia]
MASHKALLLILFVVFSSFLPSLDARKLLDMEEDSHNKKSIPALEASLVLTALPKGTVPASSPSKKGHDMVVDEKLIARHLAVVDRILRSVPSPGVGH